MANPTPPSFAAYCTAAMNAVDEYIAEALCPSVQLENANFANDGGQERWKGTAYRQEFDDNLSFPEDRDLRAKTGQEYNSLTGSIVSYEMTTFLRGNRADFPIAMIQGLPAFGLANWERDVAAPRVMSSLLIDREIRTRNLIKSTSNYNSGNVLAVTTANAWNSPTTDIIKQLEVARNRIKNEGGMRPNLMNMSQDAYDAFRNNPSIRDLVGDASSPMLFNAVTDLINQILNPSGVGDKVRLTVGTAVIKTAGADSGQYIHQNYASMHHVMTGSMDADAGLRAQSHCKTYVGRPFQNETIENREKRLRIYQVDYAADPAYFNKSLGYLWQTPVQS